MKNLNSIHVKELRLYKLLCLGFWLLQLSFSLNAQLDLDFETDRGYFDSSFNLVLSTNDPTAATIRYTTNGTKPTPSSGQIYSSPISINTTSYVRAIAYASYDTTKVLTHTYIFPDDVIDQPNSVSGFPSSGFAFDTSIKNHPSYGPQLVNSLSSTPSLSLVMKLSDFNDVHNLTTPLEYETSVEVIFPNGEKGYQANGGIERVGGSSFNSSKRNFRLSFKSIYGDSKFDYPLFGKDAADDFDQIALRPGFHGCMQLGLNHSRGGANDLADQVMRDLQGNMAKDDVQISGSFMHLYVNGIYWGVYNPTERGTNSYATSYYGGEKENWDAIKSGAALDGTITAWNTLSNMVNNLNMANAQNYANVQEYVDVEQFTDYVILTNYGPHADDHASGKNSFATRDRTNTDGFKFWMWDTEPALGHYWTWNVANFGSTPFNFIFLKLLNNSDYKTLVADRLQCHCFEDGALTPAKSIEAYDAVFDSTQIQFISEAARWAQSAEYDFFINTRDRIVNNYLPGRTNFLINLYKNNGVYPSIDAVEYNQFGGKINQSFQISISNPNGSGTIYYTTDGSDPRSSGGGISGTAQTYNGSFSLSNGVYSVKARVRVGSTWSAMCPAVFYVNQQYQDLVINEIHYNPNDLVNPPDTTSGKNFEFIEIKNCGNNSINLKDMYFEKGIRLKFTEDEIIAPGGFIVLAEDEFWFQQKYGFAPDATYKGKLDNGGENLWLVDPCGEIADSLRYNDNSPWPGTADKGYYSLALKDCSTDNAVATNWSIQSVFTTPGEENYFTDFGVHGFSGLVINEIHYNPFDSIVPGTTDTINGRKFEFIELKNITSVSIDLSGVFFSRGIEYEFDDDVEILAGDFIVLAEDKSSFEDRYGFQAFDKYDGQIDNGGESIWINNADGILLDAVNFDDNSPWDSQADGGLSDFSLALIDGEVNNDVYLNWKVQCTTLWTPGAENDVGCFPGLNYSALTITEFHYSPSQGNNHEFLELHNSSNFIMNLEELRLSNAITYKFGNHLLGPGQHIILALDSTLFVNTYGVNPVGQYVGGLSSNGETILLKDLFNETVDSVQYGVSNPWSPEPLLGIKSLALRDPNLDNSLAESWCTQQPDITPASPNIFTDIDNDSIDDCVDTCPGFDNNLIGTSCEDGDSCTIGETYDLSCNCTGGVFQDSDSDGVCDAFDQCNGIDDAIIGQPCNDGDSCTVGETFNSNCQCTGGLSGDSDNDGVCDELDECNGLDDALIGQPCDDGDICTAGETYDQQCNCVGGVFQDADNDSVCDAQDQCPNFDDALLGQACDDGDQCTLGEVYQSDCSCAGGVFQDADNDSVCDADDQCSNFDDMLIGQPCDDGNECTTGETYQTNCMCAGGVFQDADNDSVCDANDQCPNFDDNLIGQACDDGDQCTTGETYQSDCSCAGGSLLDINNNGICDVYENGCSNLYSDDFEAGMGIWQSGGDDAARVQSSNSPQGLYSLRIRDNSGLGSSFLSSALDVSALEVLRVGFNYLSVGMETGESFILELSTDSGTSFTTIETWVSGTDFVNGSLYYEQINIPAVNLSSTVVLRFQCMGSINSDEVFLDNIILESCTACVDFVSDLGFEDILFDTSAMIRIQSNGKLRSGYDVKFHAGETIDLLEGFEIELGSTFHAFIQSCE